MARRFARFLDWKTGTHENSKTGSQPGRWLDPLPGKQNIRKTLIPALGQEAGQTLWLEDGRTWTSGLGQKVGQILWLENRNT